MLSRSVRTYTTAEPQRPPSYGTLKEALRTGDLRVLPRFPTKSILFDEFPGTHPASQAIRANYTTRVLNYSEAKYRYPTPTGSNRERNCTAAGIKPVYRPPAAVTHMY